MTETTYRSIHKWLQKHYGKASKCENEECTKTSDRFEWALKKGKKHEKNADNYRQLCKLCHERYDNNPREKPKLTAHRLYEVDRKYLRMLKRNMNAKRTKSDKQISESQIVRHAIRTLHAMTFHAKA